jgi:hypothetical protein
MPHDDSLLAVFVVIFVIVFLIANYVISEREWH